MGAGRGPAGNRQPAAPGQGAGMLHRLAAGPGPGVGRPLPRGSVPQPGKLSTYFPPAGEKAPPAVAVAAAPGAGGAGLSGHRPGRAVGVRGPIPHPGLDSTGPGPEPVFLVLSSLPGCLRPGAAHPLLEEEKLLKSVVPSFGRLGGRFTAPLRGTGHP